MMIISLAFYKSALFLTLMHLKALRISMLGSNNINTAIFIV